MTAHSRYHAARKLLIFWCLFVGVGAVGGAVGMLLAPDGSIMGMQDMLPYFQVLPFADALFQNYIFPGIALLCVNGIPNLIAAGLLLAGKKSGVICGMSFGLTLMAWIVIQFVIFPLNFMSTAFFIFGLLQALTGCAAWIFYEQEHFSVQLGDYPNVGTNRSRLVVYFSRMGYTRKAAYEEADRTGAALYEVKSTERTEGTAGFWWCGRFAMHGWDMPIEKIDLDLSAYGHVTICTPVWVFHLAPPMRSFCKAAKGTVKEADYIIDHFNRASYADVARELDALLGITATNVQSRCVRYGRMVKCDTIERGPEYDAGNEKPDSSPMAGR